jgi:type I restriction enzyme M protein
MFGFMICKLMVYLWMISVSQLKANDIDDIINRYRNMADEKERKRTEKSFFVGKDEIVNNDYDLSNNKYKEVEYENVKYDPPLLIIQRIKDLEIQINDDLKELERLLN